VFVATACPVPTVVTKPVATVTELVASSIGSPTKSYFSSPPELHRPTQAVPLVQRLADKLRARRLPGLPMLLRSPCGGIVSLIGRLASTAV
jgi:hypothetical protein